MGTVTRPVGAVLKMKTFGFSPVSGAEDFNGKYGNESSVWQEAWRAE
jgi:hypothetical protein